jgi:hypothetical protein
MRTWSRATFALSFALPIALLLAGGCPPKTPQPVEPVPVPIPTPVPVPAPEPAPEPITTAAELPPAQRPHNADFTAAIDFADGTNVKGKVVRVERTEDWYGEKGWTARPEDLKLTAEGGGAEAELPWTDITRIDITYGSTPADVDCSYDSSYDPAMYICVNRTTTKVKTKDGKAWDGIDRHKWMFVFESGETPEFWVSKPTARRQEDGVPALGTTAENTKLYQILQNELEQMRGGKVPKSITITAP